MAEKWYRDGLSFKCTQCGHCCTGETGYVWVTLKEIDRLARRVGTTTDAFGSKYLRRVGRRYSLTEKVNGDCVFWDKGCTVYEDRPTQCRTFPFWPEILKSRHAWEEESESECPGMDHGTFYSLDEIDVIRKGGGDASSAG